MDLKKMFIFTILMFFVSFNVQALTCEYTSKVNDEDVKYKVVINSKDDVVVYKNDEEVKEGTKIQIFESDKYDECPSQENISISETFYRINIRSKVSCGNITGIPEKIPQIVSFLMTMLYISIPIILVIMGSLDLFKGISAGKEDDIKKGQQLFIKRLIYAAVIFFVVVVAKILVSVVADASSADIVECIDCFISGVENCGR